MENIFENACFGKFYRTRDGRKAIYNYHSTGGYHDIIIDGEGMSYHFADHTNGTIRLPLPSEIDPDVDYSCPVDIVSEWTEPIDEEENELTKEDDKKVVESHWDTEGFRKMCRWIDFDAPCGYVCLYCSKPVERNCRLCSAYEPRIKEG